MQPNHPGLVDINLSAEIMFTLYYLITQSQMVINDPVWGVNNFKTCSLWVVEEPGLWCAKEYLCCSLLLAWGYRGTSNDCM